MFKTKGGIRLLSVKTRAGIAAGVCAFFVVVRLLSPRSLLGNFDGVSLALMLAGCALFVAPWELLRLPAPPPMEAKAAYAPGAALVPALTDAGLLADAVTGVSGAGALRDLARREPAMALAGAATMLDARLWALAEQAGLGAQCAAQPPLQVLSAAGLTTEAQSRALGMLQGELAGASRANVTPAQAVSLADTALRVLEALNQA